VRKKNKRSSYGKKKRHQRMYRTGQLMMRTIAKGETDHRCSSGAKRGWTDRRCRFRNKKAWRRGVTYGKKTRQGVQVRNVKSGPGGRLRPLTLSGHQRDFRPENVGSARKPDRKLECGLWGAQWDRSVGGLLTAGQVMLKWESEERRARREGR